MGELIAVLSGKGGTGKTSVCAAVASALALDGKRVLCVDCDVGLKKASTVRASDRRHWMAAVVEEGRMIFCRWVSTT